MNPSLSPNILTHSLDVEVGRLSLDCLSSEEGDQSFMSCPSRLTHSTTPNHRFVEDIVSVPVKGNVIISLIHPPQTQDDIEQISGSPTSSTNTAKLDTKNQCSDLTTPTDEHLTAIEMGYRSRAFSSETSDSSQKPYTTFGTRPGYEENCTSLNSYKNNGFHESLPDYQTSPPKMNLEVMDHKRSVEIVRRELNEKEDPLKFSKVWKWFITISVSFLCFTVTLGTAIVTADVVSPAKELKMSIFTSGLTMTLFVVGLGIGPLIYAPISEFYGRKTVYVLSMSLYTLCTIPSALAPCPTVLLTSRVMAGLFGGAPLTNVGGSISDIWELNERGLPMAILTYFTFAGPVLGPLIGTFVTDVWGWRSAYWTLFAFSTASVMMTLIVPETLSLVLIRRKRARQNTNSIIKDDGGIEFQDPFPPNKSFSDTFWPQLKLAIVKPFKMLATEPILVCMTAYLSLITVTLYYFFFAYPIVFQDVYHYSNQRTAIAFIPIFVGVFPAIAMTPVWDRIFKQMVDRGPEARLIPMMFGAIMLPGSIFTFAWTSAISLGVVGPSISGLLFGFCVASIWTSANAYLVDSFPGSVASAIAGATVVRCFCGASVPLWVFSLLDSIGPRWASSLLGFITVLMIPIPFIFFRWGEKFRSK